MRTDKTEKSQPPPAEGSRALAGHGWLGIILVAIFWPLNWVLPGAPTAYLFFPLWLGYVLIMDALVLRRRGESILSRSRSDFVKLFLCSAPAWWLFEVINWRTENWEYTGGERFTGVPYFILASVSFSTVMPAVFETAEWVATWGWVKRWGGGMRLNPGGGLLAGMFGVGAVMFALVMIYPKVAYPLVWGALVLMLEPVNVLLGRRSFFDHLKEGDWQPVVALATGALICGGFWEMWNYYSNPRWVYHTPGAEFWYIFEMPLLGYLGYPPFALELYVLRNLFWPGAPNLKLSR